MNLRVKNFIIPYILFAFISKINSQTNVDFATEKALMSKDISSKVEADGSPYINEAYQAMKINIFGDKIYMGRYNAFNDEMEVKLSESKVVAIDNSADIIITFRRDKKSYKLLNYLDDKNKSKRGFLLVVEESKNYSLLKREYIKFYEGRKAASSYQQDKSPTFKREDDTYFLKLNNNITYIPTKKKDFLNKFSNHSSSLNSFIKKNKINLKKVSDLKATVKYLSTL